MIAGAGHATYERQLRRHVSTLGLGGSVTFSGVCNDRQRDKLFDQCELFILPTRSENYGRVIAEALVAGVPVITTQAAPWKWLPEERAGWWIPVAVESLAQSVMEATSLNADELHAMGQRGQRRAMVSCGWPSVVRQYEAAYDWILGCSSPPACIRF